MTDPIADMLTRIRNAYMAGKKSVKMPYSKLKTNIAEILKKSHYIDSIKINTEGNHKNLNLSYVSPSVKIHGYDYKNLAGTNVKQFFHPEDEKRKKG